MTTSEQNFNREQQPQQPGAQVWEKARVYQEEELIWENDGEAFECIRGGRSGNEKPVFPVGSRIVVNDAEVMWRGYPRMNRTPVEQKPGTEANGNSNSNRQRGVVRWFNAVKGFGFIDRPGQPNVFVHYSEIQGTGYRQLEQGQTVEYELTATPKGPAAVDVVVVG